MNKILRNTLGAAALAIIAICTCISCSDTWEEHYDSMGGLTFDGTTMGYLQSQSDLSDFVEILKASGYDKELDASQVLTVMAPKNGTFNKAELLAKIADGDKKEVVEEFVENHICRYNISISAKPQTITMLNDKNVEVGTLANATVGDANAVSANVSCDNGVVHVLDNYLPYQFNIYEYIGKNYNAHKNELNADDENFETWYGYLKELYVDSLDERRSVSRGVDENGDNIWALPIFSSMTLC